MGLYTKLDTLNPIMQRRVKAFLSALEEKGIEVAIVETTRTKEVQAAYFAQGRKTLAEVNEMRQNAGLWKITEAENRNKVTNCDGVKNKSNHQVKADGFGYAVDIVPMKNGRANWNATQKEWETIGAIGESCGLDWAAGGYGSTWGKGWDNPHFEYNGDMWD